MLEVVGNPLSEPYAPAPPPAPGAVVRTHDDGRLEVVQAPRHAEFSAAMLARPNPAIGVDEAGYLRLGGQVTYRPLRFRQAPGGLMLVCERVR